MRTPEAKERLAPALFPGNLEKTMSAPVTAIIAYDKQFYEQLPRLFPHADMRAAYANNPALSEITAIRNSSIQGGYFIIAARSLGLDCGPMSGFDEAKVNQEFCTGEAAGYRVNFLCNLGYGDHGALYPRGPRLELGEACQFL